MNKKRVTFLIISLVIGTSLFAMGTSEVATDSSASTESLETETTNLNSSSGLEIVAEHLGVSVENLQTALGAPSQGGPNYTEVAEKLNVDATQLEQLMKDIIERPSVEVDPYTINLNGNEFTITYEVFTWDELPDDLAYEKEGIQEFTDDNGTVHYYEAIYLPDGNLNWYQAAYLAQDAGGYLACINSQEENDFVFSLVDDDKFFWHFEEGAPHYGIAIGPFLGGFQPEGSVEPDGGWQWLSGEPFDYINWAQNLDDGVIDKDPRDDTQPNDSGDGQPIMGFGELNLPVPTWGDYMESVGTYGASRGPGYCHGFVIEYESKLAQ